MALIGRRSFVSSVASFLGVGAVGLPAGAREPLVDGEFDLAWLEQMKGKHKQLYDLGSFDLAGSMPPMHFAENFLNTARDTFHLEFPDVNTAVGISGPAFPLNCSDRIWAKYKLGERSKIMDPATKQPATRNVFMDGETGMKAMQARGTVFWQCNVALGGIAGALAEANHLPVAEVRADLVAGLVPGVKLMPSHVLALALAQERGFTYMKP